MTEKKKGNKKKEETKQSSNKRGLKPGTTNNPNGRPKGSANILSRAIKAKLVGKLEEKDFANTVVDKLYEIKKPNEFLNQARHLYPFVFSRAISEEEEEGIKTQSQLFTKLLPRETKK